MQKRKFLMVMLSLLLLITIGAGCSPDKKALKDEQGNVVAIDAKETPTLLFFFTGIG